MAKKKLPKFKKEAVVDNFVVDKKLRKLGVELSKSLPTYDVPIDLITASGWNPNEMDDKTFNRLVQEMEETGFIDPIQIIPAKGERFVILGGEHRWHGAKTLGWKTVPCNILMDKRFLDPSLQKLIGVRLNVIKGKLNPDKFIALKEEMVKVYGEEQLEALFGFTSTDAWNKLTGGVVKAMEATGVGGKKMAKELKKKSKEISTVDGLGIIINKLFKKYGGDLAQNFMVFTFGGKEHLYIVANEKMMKSLEKAKALCRKKKLDINDVIAPAIENLFIKEKKRK